MGANANLKLMTTFSPEQTIHVAFMRLLVKNFRSLPLVLKGGTALLLGYGLPRFSEDLDFDSEKRISLESIIQKTAPWAGVKINDIKIKKDTETVKRYTIDYGFTEGEGRLKIEMSLRNEELKANNYALRGGMRIYPIGQLISQKINAMSARAKVRDLFDVNFLLSNYAQEFSLRQVVQLQQITGNVFSLVARYKADHEDDAVLKSANLDDLALNFMSRLEDLSSCVKSQTQEESPSPGVRF
jgi:predicted nucleotidyltransferase component of viral defense system